MTEEFPKLTSRQRQVAELIAEGCPVDEIARILEISKYTASDHCKAVYRAFGFKTRIEAYPEIAKYAYTFGAKSLSFPHYTSSSINRMRITNNGKTAVYFRSSECVCLSQSIEFYEEETFTDGDSTTIKMDGIEVPPFREIRGAVIYRYNYSKPIIFGETFRREVEIVYKDCFTGKTEDYWSTLTQSPNLHGKFEILFDPPFQPEYVVMRFRHGDRKFEKELTRGEGGFYIYEAVMMEYGSYYDFHWCAKA